jgi:glycosyltransferase involved in cell wall biosynthesis
MRVLFVCNTEIAHSQPWINLFADDDDFEVRVFAHNLVTEGVYQPQAWENPTYTLIPPVIHRENRKIIPFFPASKYAKSLFFRIANRASLNDWYLQSVIGKWKPDVVHSLSLLPVGYTTFQALNKIKQNCPFFIASSWGSDINMGKDIAIDRPQLEAVLNHCDGFIADCKRDIKNALSLGLPQENVAFDFAVPVNGGIDLQKITGGLPLKQRNVILLPKAYEGFENKILPVLEALNIIRDKLDGFEIHLLVASEDVKRYLKLMPEDFQKYCRIRTQLPHDEVLDLMKRARVMVAPSISDGSPVILLEAMAFGVLPVMSPLESIKEWIEDGKNGLLAHALHPNKIAEALARALCDDQLFDSAAMINREIIEKRANRERIKPQVKNYFKSLMNKKSRN